MVMQKVSTLVSKEIGNYLTNRATWNIFYNAKSEGLAGDGTTDDYADLSTLINTTINGAEATIIFSPGTYKISTSITVPSNITLFLTKGAMLSPDSGKTITINGPVEAGLWKIFTGSGTIAGSMKVERVFPQWWGAVNDGVTDDTSSFQAALTAISTAGGGVLCIPYGTYLLSLASTINLPSNCTVYNFGTLNMGSSTIVCFTATSKSNVRFIGGQINGTGVNGAAWVFYFNTCSDSSIENVTIRDGSSTGINFAACNNCKVLHSDIQECYFYAIADKNGTGNVFSHNELSNNGYGASTTGRGITVWMCDGAEVSFNKVKGNNEYGIRVYTEAADASSTKKVRIIGNECVDNATIDLHVYGTGIDVIVSDNIIEQTTDSSATGINISGTGVKAVNNTMRKPGIVPDGPGFVMFGSTQCDIKNNKVFGYATVISASGTSKPSKCVIEGNEAYDCKLFVKMFGADNIVRNNTAFHYATAAVSGEYGYQQGDNSTGCVVDGNKFTSFHSGVLLDHNVEIVVKNNVCRSSVHSNFRSGLTDLHSTTIIGNDWADAASAEILRSLEVRNGRYVFTATAIPSTGMSSFVFAVGDYAIMRTPVAAGNLAWVCTTAGTPGTWKTAGVIGA